LGDACRDEGWSQFQVSHLKRLASVERDFRALKGDDLAVRPIFHWRV
jgi:transposase